MTPTWLLALALGALPQAVSQDEARFHRIHLRNGNFLDGQIVRQSPSEVQLLLKGGQMHVRRDQIDRIEIVKMKHVSDKEIVMTPPPAPPGPAVAPAPAKAPAPAGRRPRGSAASAGVSAEVKAKAEAIFDRLRNGSPEQKAEAGTRLRDLGPDAAVYAADVLDTLDDGSIGIVASILVDLKSPDVVTIVQGKLSNPRPRVRTEAAAVLGACAEKPEDVRPLLPLLNDASPLVVLPALSALARHGVTDAAAPAARLAASKDPDVRRGALKALVEIAKKQESLGDLASLFSDLLEKSTGDAKSDVLTEIGSAKLAALAPQVAALLDEENPSVRAKAAQVVGDLGDRETGTAVLERLPDETDKWTRVFLAQAALKLRLQNALDPLIEWMDAEDADVRVAAYESLKKLSGQDHGIKKDAWVAWRRASKNE